MKRRTEKLPRPLGTYRGTKFAEYTAHVSQEKLVGGQLVRGEAEVRVIAESPAAAANLVKWELAPHVSDVTEIRVAGPKGGITYRSIGWRDMIGSHVDWNAKKQLTLNLD